MKRIFIIADDLTGALDTSVKFSEQGLNVLVLRDGKSDFSGFPDVDVLVINTDTRHVSTDIAYKTVFEMTRRAMDAGFDFVFKKTDSALRGNIGAELSAVSDAMNSGIRFIAAYPSVGRITKNGIQYIDGIPVSESVFAKDPFNPVESSNIAEILKKQSNLNVVTHENKEDFVDCAINVYDAITCEDVQKIVDAFDEKVCCAAGCAGLACAIANSIKPKSREVSDISIKGPVLISCGSINPITTRQIDVMKNNGLDVEYLRPDEKLNSEYIGSKEFSQKISSICDALKKRSLVCVCVNDIDGEVTTNDYANKRGYSCDFIKTQITNTLAAITVDVVDRFSQLSIMCIGGDTLFSILNSLKVESIKPIAELFHGVVYCEILCNDKKYNLITKSGGFGKENLFVDLVREYKIS